MNTNVNVKVCGITTLEDALMVAQYPIWALGFNFYTKSPRYVAPETAANIIHHMPTHILCVGVFVNASLEHIMAIQKRTGIHGVQLHGDESLAFCRAVSEHVTGPVIKALPLHGQEDIDTAALYKELGPVLVDAFHPKLYGGTGERCNWVLAASLSKEVSLILAGGLNGTTIVEAFQQVAPWAVDVCSGLEKYPGKKCPNKVRDFMKQIQEMENYNAKN